MGNALQKASPAVTNKHSALNNSQLSDATADRSLLNATDDNVGTMLINDPRSPTDGINRTPIQISRTKSLFRGMFSGRKPSQPELAEYASSANAGVIASDGSPEEVNKNAEAVSVTTSAQESVPAASTPLSEGNVPKVNNVLKRTEEDVKENKSPKIAVPHDESTTDHDVTTENEEAFIVVDNKKKQKKKQQREKAESKNRTDSESQKDDEDIEDQYDNLTVSASKVPLTKRHSDSNLAGLNAEQPQKSSEKNDSASKQRNENDAPSMLRVKVEKACRSLTNLSSKGKGISVNNKAINSVRAEGEEATGTSAPTSTTSPLADACCERENTSGKYMQLVNDE